MRLKWSNVLAAARIYVNEYSSHITCSWHAVVRARIANGGSTAKAPLPTSGNAAIQALLLCAPHTPATNRPAVWAPSQADKNAKNTHKQSYGACKHTLVHHLNAVASRTYGNDATFW